MAFVSLIPEASSEQPTDHSTKHSAIHPTVARSILSTLTENGLESLPASDNDQNSGFLCYTHQNSSVSTLLIKALELRVSPNKLTVDRIDKDKETWSACHKGACHRDWTLTTQGFDGAPVTGVENLGGI